MWIAEMIPDWGLLRGISGIRQALADSKLEIQILGQSSAGNLEERGALF